jgi:hypothetical protein
MSANNASSGRSYSKLVATKLSSNFREATQVQTAALPDSAKLATEHVLVRNVFAGVNASDVNYTAGKYLPGVKPPFDCGFESIGVVIALGGSEAEQQQTRTKYQIKEGDTVAVVQYGAYAEYQIVRARLCIGFGRMAPSPALLPLLVSGLTASIALEQAGGIKIGSSDKSGKKLTVLVTAAAGGTGLFAVQLAKLSGHHVIATCSSPAKAAYLKQIGADRVVDYKSESLDAVLKKEYKKGVDVVYESVGGETFDVALKHLSVFGRLIVIGMIAGYTDQSAWQGSAKPRPHVSAYILGKSASVVGFFLNNYTHLWRSHAAILSQLVARGEMRSVYDTQLFRGVAACVDAVEYLYTGKNIGKVIVHILSEEDEAKLLNAYPKRDAAAQTPYKSKL